LTLTSDYDLEMVNIKQQDEYRYRRSF